jgi:hypothetical protein
MVGRVMAVALVMAALMSKPLADAEATSLPSLSLRSGAPLDECQGCDSNYGEVDGTWIAWYAYFENNEGHCDSVQCVRCNGNPDCEPVWGSGEFESSGAAALWLDSNSSCGNCSQEGGGTASLAMATEMRDAGRVAEIIASSGGSTWLNRDRGAVQALGCGGKVGVHLPLDAALLTAVLGELDQLEAIKD